LAETILVLAAVQDVQEFAAWVDDAASAECRMKMLLIAPVSALAIMVANGEVAKSEQSAAIQEVEIFMKRDATCKWPPFASAFIHNKNTESRVRATITVTTAPPVPMSLIQER